MCVGGKIAVKDSDDNTLWQADEHDIYGHLTQFHTGNGLTTYRDYDSENGRLLGIITSDGRNLLQNYAYTYDDFCIFAPFGRIVRNTMNKKSLWKYHYTITDHLGNTRVEFVPHNGSQPEVVQSVSYYPFGYTLHCNDYGSRQPNRHLFGGKELQDQTLAGITFGWYDFETRMYDPAIGRFMQTDPMAESNAWLTPYHYCSNNPIRKIDPTGMNDDWIYDKEKDQYVWDGNVIDENSTPDGFEYIGRSLNDVNDHFKENNPFLSIFINPKFGPDRTPYPGEIRDAGFDLEMWLDSPSEGALATVGKIGSNFLYNIVNSPYVLFTGRTIGGRHVTSNEIVESFGNVAISVIAFGLRGTGQVLKTGEGLQGYNDFLKKSSKMGTLFNGIGWQKQAGKAFKTNKNIYKSIDSYDNFKYIIDGLHSTYDEIKK